MSAADHTLPTNISLAGRVALVTGGSRGIGAAICVELARQGAAIAINYNSSAGPAEEVRAQCAALGVKAKTYKASLESYDEVKAMADAVLADFGFVDILVHNGGIASSGKTIQRTDPREYAKLMGSHYFGPAWLTGILLPSLRERAKETGRADVISISSVVTRQLPSHGAPYNAAKAAGNALMDTLYKEVQKYGIRVNTIAPGLVYTDMGTALIKKYGVENIEELDRSFPFQRVCRPVDIARVVVFFASQLSGYVSGQRVFVDGGGSTRANL